MPRSLIRGSKKKKERRSRDRHKDSRSSLLGGNQTLVYGGCFLVLCLSNVYRSTSITTAAGVGTLALWYDIYSVAPTTLRIEDTRGSTDAKAYMAAAQRKYEGFTVDILSVGSNTRPEYMETQRKTWANHPLVRHFFNVTEDLDTAQIMMMHDGSRTSNSTRKCTDMSLREVLRVPRWCKNRYLSAEDSENFSWIMQRLMHYYASPTWLQAKANPAGWLCAQKRFPLGLAKTVLGYNTRRRRQEEEALPDYLLLVDDDTYYNMDLFFDTVVQPRNSQTPFVGAGCRVTNGRDMESGVVFPFGGFGLTFSKGSLQRLLQPLERAPLPSRTGNNNDNNDIKAWTNNTISIIQENLIFERSSFRDGMSLAELMEAFATEEPFQDISTWTRGFCFHGDWILAMFTQFYGLHSSKFMDALQGSEITLVDGLTSTGLCKNNNQTNCHTGDLACHYQTPADMERLSWETLAKQILEHKVWTKGQNTSSTRP